MNAEALTGEVKQFPTFSLSKQLWSKFFIQFIFQMYKPCQVIH